MTTTEPTTAETTTATSRIALVTGGNRGLGRSEVLALAAAGNDIVLTYRSGEDQAAQVADAVRALGRRAAVLQLDTTATGTFEQFATDLTAVLREQWQRNTLDILVNNAGFAAPTPLGGITVDTVNSLVAVHFTGVVMLTQTLVPLLADGGRIINTSTGLARFVGDFGLSVYASIKGAVEVWTRYLAQELGARRITVNAVAPGATATDFGGGSLRDDEQVRSGLATVIAMGHVGLPDDIGAAVAAIASENMSWVTGQRIEASGGMRL
ncbi:SDR family oxidoreductase [Nakamurella sp. YIM 132087]|uniref:SDR family oxidoreductase n=1 Tax=Nakamurella alba TaxID=2665158 RepID=A0A7K1FSB2_9ACTN|nr:SDR family oxidoreductase [Nakamurella alba]MTD17037.1 SDR family oxidoreductase [Nakamurella alba]